MEWLLDSDGGQWLLTIILNFTLITGGGLFIGHIFKKRLAFYTSELQKSVANHTSEIQETLEKQKARNESKIHITKVRFDTEFQVYRTLSIHLADAKNATEGLHFDTWEDDVRRGFELSHQMIDPDFDDHEGYRERRRKSRNEGYRNLIKIRKRVLREIEGNAPIISKEIFIKYAEINDIFSKFIDCYAFVDRHIDELEVTETLMKAKNASDLLIDKYEEVNQFIRDYLDTLEII